MDQIQTRNTFRHNQPKTRIGETSELAERQLSAQTENKMIGGKVVDEISKLCASQGTKNVLEDGSIESVWAH